MQARSMALTVLAVLFAPTLLWAQCTDWIAGPMDNGTLPNGADLQVRATMVWTPPGGSTPQLVVAGDFTSIQGVAANHIATLDPTTGLWQPLGSGTNDNVTSLTVFDGELIAGGFFTEAGGASANYAARWNGSSWQPLPYGVNPNGTNGPVLALTVYNGALILGGSFSQAGGLPASRIISWTLAGSFASLGVGVACLNGSCSGQVNALSQYNGELIAAGSFGYAGNQVARYVAGWNGSSWRALPGGELNGEVTSLQPFNGELVIGGRFSQVQFVGSHIDVNHVTRWDGANWQGLSTGTVGDVTSLSVFTGSLIVGGGLSSAGGVPVNGVAKWTGASWQALASGITQLGSGGYPNTFYPYGDEMIAGGYFDHAGVVPASNLARWDGSQWSSFGGGTAGSVFAMTNYIGRLVVGGNFHQYAGIGTAAHCIAGWDGVRMYPYGTGMNSTVVALKSFKYPGVFGANELIAGGSFTQAGGVAANFIARWDQDPFIAFPPPAWAAMGAGFNSQVLAIERYNNVTYAGGPFTLSGGTGVSRIARWNETTDVWEPVGTGMNGAVRAMKEYNGNLYVGGDFTTAGGVATGGLARWNGTSWSAVSGVFNGQVHEMDAFNGLLVIGGQFAGVGGSPNVVYFDGTSLGPLAGGTNGRVQAVLSTGTHLYIGGEFTQAGGSTANHMATWTGFWEETSGGTNDMVLALRAFNGEIHAGGLFTSVQGGTIPAACWAKVSETGVPWIAYQPSSRTASPGDNVTFTAQPAAGYSDLTFQWYRFETPLADGPTGTGSLISGATTSSLTLSNISHTDYGDYRMVLSSPCGDDTSSIATLNLTGQVGVTPGGPAATRFDALGPNPLRRGSADLAFSLARAARVRVRVDDIAGRRVRGIEVGTLSAGRHQAGWDTRDDCGQRVRPGLYFVRLEVDGRSLGAKRLAVLD